MPAPSRKSPAATKADIAALRAEFHADLRASNKELIGAFKVMNEELLHDFRGAFLDRTEQQTHRLDDHERRLVKVEGKLGLAA